MDKETEYFLKEDIEIAKRKLESAHTANQRGNAIKTQMNHHLTPVRMAISIIHQQKTLMRI